MTPDMKRLCEAAYEADRADDTKADYEAIVRAVLLALREPSDAVLDAVFERFNDDDVSGDMYEGLPRHHVRTILELASDHILDTKARRAAALQDLANLDRDLL